MNLINFKAAKHFNRNSSTPKNRTENKQKTDDIVDLTLHRQAREIALEKRAFAELLEEAKNID